MNTLSVVIPTFDRPDLLPVTLKKLERQTAPPHEVIVVDNGTTPAVIGESLGLSFSLRSFRICARAGAAQARNFGAAMATGTYVAFLDDDDYWDPDYLERIARIVDNGAAHPPAMIVGRIDHLRNDQRNFYRFAGDDPGIEPCFYFNPGYVGSNLTVARSTFMDAGGFDATFKTGEDKELVLRYLARQLPVVYDRDLAAVLRVHSGHLSGQGDYVAVAEQLLRKYPQFTNLKVRLKARREAYKKSHRRRYVLHKAVLKAALVVLSALPQYRSPVVTPQHGDATSATHQ